MASDGGREKQQPEEEQLRHHRRREEEQKQGKEGGLGGDSPPAGSDTGGGESGGGEPNLPLHPLLAIPVPREHLADLSFLDTPVDIDRRPRAPHGWQRCLSLTTGRIFYKDPAVDWKDEDMSRDGKNQRLDMRPNPSTHHGSYSGGSGGGGSSGGNNNNNRNHNNNRRSNPAPRRSSSSSSSSSSASPPSSCLSSETDPEPEPSSMVLVGCPHCLMYVMLSEEDPRCPKCKSTVLLDFLNDPKNGGSTSTGKPKNK